ncbi:MAG: hypothetical protein AB7J32_17210 [Pseudonocardia sp.]
MSANAEYITVLVIAIGLTVVVGRLLVVAGEPYLLEVFRDRKVTRSVNRLLSVLFHLITLGVLAIISAIDISLDSQLQTVVVKLGIVLLVLGIAYGVSMLVLIRIRQRRQADQISAEVSHRLAEQGAPGVASSPDEMRVAGGAAGSVPTQPAPHARR